MPLERKDIEVALLKKGFKQKDGDHSFFTYWTTDGKKSSVFTKTSHGSSYKTLSDDLVGKMAKQCGVATGQFKQLVACPLSRQDFQNIIVTNGRISL